MLRECLVREECFLVADVELVRVYDWHCTWTAMTDCTDCGRLLLVIPHQDTEYTTVADNKGTDLYVDSTNDLLL